MDPAQGVGGGREHQLAHHVGVPDNDLQGDVRAHAVAEEVGLLDAQLSKGGDRVIGHLLRRQRTIDVGRVTMRLHLQADHLPGLGQPGENVLKGRADRGERPVQQHKRLSFAVDLVVHVEAVDWRVPRANRCHVGRFGHRLTSPPTTTYVQQATHGSSAAVQGSKIPSTTGRPEP